MRTEMIAIGNMQFSILGIAYVLAVIALALLILLRLPQRLGIRILLIAVLLGVASFVGTMLSGVWSML